MLRLIQLLHQLSELRGDFGETDERSCFISQHLTRKLERQFNDNIGVMTGPAFPNWCFSLTQKMNFLFPFKLRLELFKACAFGPARYICSQGYHIHLLFLYCGHEFRVASRVG